MRKHFQTRWLGSLAFGAALLVGCSGKEAERPPLTASQLRGQRLYQTACALCHRADSEKPLNGPGLKDMFSKKFLTSGAPATDERVIDVIRHGRRSMPGNPNLSDQQMTDLIAYLHSL